jgi:peptide/nickel transport system permease protein
MTVQLPDTALGGGPRPAVAAGSAGRGWARRVGSTVDLWLPGGVLLFIAAACFLWPLVDSGLPGPTSGELDEALRPFLSPGHLLGTDALGNDILSRLLYGGRVSLEVGLGANAIGLLVGGFIGMFAGFKGGLVESTIMRVLDVFLAFPALILAIVIATYLGPSKLNVIWAISLFSVPAFSRLARAATLRLREQVYISAAKLAGHRDRTILLRHVAPNVLPQLLTFGLLSVGIAIVVEATLSFLGLGVPPPQASWGNMISAGQADLAAHPELVLVPSALLFVTVMALNLLGDALRRRWGSA